MQRNSYKARKRRKRKIVLRRWVLIFITVLITISLVFGIVGIIKILFPESFSDGFIPAPFGRNISERVEKAKELSVPDYVDVQLINKHGTARTGFELNDIKNVVIHYVGNPDTTAQNNRDYFNKWDTKVSSHFVVGLNGEIIQCVPLYEKSAASNNRNKDTISIEVCHPDETGIFNDETYDSVVKLVSWICNEFSLDESDVIRHYDITGKICPKYYVENEDAWDTLKNDVKEKLKEYEKQ